MGIINQKKDEQKYISRYRKQYGSKDVKAMKLSDFEDLSLLINESEDNEFFIDDITWNDLDMNSVFNRINRTVSLPGEEYLYKMLRYPANIDELQRRDKIITDFSNCESDRLKAVTILKNIKKSGKASFSAYISMFMSCPKLSLGLQLSALCMGIITFSFIFINPPLGFLMLIISLIFNLMTYFSQKKLINPYLCVIAYILNLIKYTEKLVKADINSCDDILVEIKDVLSKCKPIRGYSFIVMGNSAAIAGNFADIFLDYLRMYFHLDLFAFSKMMKIVVIDSDKYLKLWNLAGKIDAFIAVSDYRKSLDHYCKPEFDKHTVLRADGIYHPLLNEPVDNDICLENNILLTGSNASGKSTFLKTVALNTILAQTIFTVAAQSYKAKLYEVMTSMALSDNIAKAESYYMAEIRSLKRILDRKGRNILCCIDEVLRGTNTAERIAASASILKYLSDNNISTLAATHDLELATLLNDSYKNFHFAEIIKENEIVFPYKIIEGIADTKNAIKLLSMMGYSKEITDEANERCARFLEDGIWM